MIVSCLNKFTITTTSTFLLLLGCYIILSSCSPYFSSSLFLTTWFCFCFHSIYFSFFICQIAPVLYVSSSCFNLHIRLTFHPLCFSLVVEFEPLPEEDWDWMHKGNWKYIKWKTLSKTKVLSRILTIKKSFIFPVLLFKFLSHD